MAIVDGPVSLMEEARPVQEVAEARALEAVLSPLDLGRRTSPRLSLKNRPVALGEFAVETGVVRDDNHSFVRE
jgi:hypothetical protein